MFKRIAVVVDESLGAPGFNNFSCQDAWRRTTDGHRRRALRA